MELGHRLCSIGSGPQGQYLVNQLTGEVLQLEQGWLWSLAWDASGQGLLTKEANGVCERVWLSSMLKVAIWKHDEDHYVLETGADLPVPYHEYMSSFTSHQWPFAGIVEGGHMFILGWALARPHFGSSIYISLGHWYKAFGLPGPPNEWYHRWWASWSTWLGQLGLGLGQLKKAIPTKHIDCEAEAAAETADLKLPSRFWPYPSISLSALVCLAARWAAQSKGMRSKSQPIRSAALSFLTSVVGSLGSYSIIIFTAGRLSVARATCTYIHVHMQGSLVCWVHWYLMQLLLQCHMCSYRSVVQACTCVCPVDVSPPS